MLCANMELAERIDESALDMTAADTAPRPEHTHMIKLNKMTSNY